MKNLRKPFFCRVITCFFLVVFLQSLLLPYYSIALTSGPHQPEFTSYESPGSSDMVNLLTGDFSFNIPILDVPSPEGNFSLPLSYHGGIGPEQEASWVGLGFNINAGAIVRNVNQYPDDASGEAKYVTVQNLTGYTAWNRVWNHPIKDDWNSETGYHKNINLMESVEIDVRGNKTDIGISGFHVGDNGTYINPVQLATNIVAAITWGYGSAASALMTMTVTLAEMGLSTAVNFALTINMPGAPSAGYWGQYSQTTSRAHWDNDYKMALLSGPPRISRKKSTKIWLDQTRTEDMFGVLYLGNPTLETSYGNTVKINNGTASQLMKFTKSTGTANKGAASDINFSLDNNLAYENQDNVTALATDNYSVYANGISGSISPYRLEIGSVSMPREMTVVQNRLAPLPYLNDYKVPFIYENSISNENIQHAGGATSVSPSFYYGMDSDVDVREGVSMGGTTYTYHYDLLLSDYIFSNRIQSDFVSNKKIPQSNNIEWFSNEEIKTPLSASSELTPTGFLDFLSATPTTPGDYTTSDRHRFRSNYTLGTSAFPSTYTTNMASFAVQIPVTDAVVLSQLDVNSTFNLTIWDNTTSNSSEFPVVINSKNSSSITIGASTAFAPYFGKNVNLSFVYYKTPQLQKGIGGYSITGGDGLTYHFALPGYDFENKAETILITDANKRSIFVRNTPFANTWLLTTVTGPDFIDRNSNGIADEADWGYWVKLNYGKHADNFDYRTPFANELPDPSGLYKSYEKGKKQLYYLNSIETRSHVALFMKSSREDGKSATLTIAPLKLDEICLLKKEQFKKLISNFGTANFTNKINSLCLSSQFLNAAIRDYVNKNCIRRTIFKYNYDLCTGTLNAGGPNNPLQGKLSLESISVKGRNDIKIVPDFKFQYGNNPAYDQNKWDGWGMYKSSGTSAAGNHATTDDILASSGSAWSLTKITTPIGSDILINYERDSYASISGENFPGSSISYSSTNKSFYYPSDLPIKKLYINPTGLSLNEKINIIGSVNYTCGSNPAIMRKDYQSMNCIISEIGSDYIKVLNDYTGLGTCNLTNSGTGINFQNQDGVVQKISTGKTGGNLRVGSITLHDDLGIDSKLRYLYTNDDGSSSGVVAQEPDYIKGIEYPFYDYLKYPQTPVMYGKVSVLNGPLTNDADFKTKQVFEFETPHKSLLTITSVDMGSDLHKRKVLFKIEDRTSKIGKLKSVKIMDASGVTSESQLIYTDKLLNSGVDNLQGVFSEGTMLTDHTGDDEVRDPDAKIKMNRTTVLTFPYTLKKIINLKDGFSSTSENLSWDLYTGLVDETLEKSSLGVYVKTVTRPAYKYYPEMGSKAKNANNKNMLLQNAGTYIYKSDPVGNSLGLISAETQTWSNDWTTYRYNTGNSQVPFDDEGVQTNKMWRKSASYVWFGDYSKLQSNGMQTFIPSDEFNYGGSNPFWKYAGEYKRYNHNGVPLETVDFNGNNLNTSLAIYNSTKLGYDDRMIIASASNAMYNEIAFSSAEDRIPNTSFFGGEVGLGGGTVVSSSVHTGYNALSVDIGNFGFVFKSSTISTTKIYRASVWTNSPNGRLYYKFGTGSAICPGLPDQTVSQTVAINNVNWYRIDLVIKNPTSSVIEVGVKSLSGTAIFDDFRFQPADASMNCYVYPPLDYEYTINPGADSPSYLYTLDNDNLFTKYEVNERGEAVKVFGESLKFGVKIISDSKIEYRRTFVNP